jgi:hypothetical protein
MHEHRLVLYTLLLWNGEIAGRAISPALLNVYQTRTYSYWDNEDAELQIRATACGYISAN